MSLRSTPKHQILRTYAFIDASNMIYGARAEGWLIDQKKLRQYLSTKYQVELAYFFYGIDRSNPKQLSFVQKLKVFGYELRLKDLKRYGKKVKANCDVDLTVEMCTRVSEYNRAVVLTGDGDFLPLFRHLHSKLNKEVIIIASPKRTAKELKQFAGSSFVSLNSLRYFIEYKKKRETLN